MEIERKFLVEPGGAWRRDATSSHRMRQGYLCVDPARSVRIRLAGDEAWLTIKGPGDGPARAEFEFSIPPAEAAALLDQLCLRPQIDKTRHVTPYRGLVFEVDEFHGDNEGLILAEVELDSVDARVELPAWISREVTGDPRYYNASLVRQPYSAWRSQTGE